MSAAEDAIAAFWTQPVAVERYLGSGPDGDVYAPAETLLCRVKHEPRLIRDSTGQEVVSQSRASAAAGTPTVPVGSLATFPGDAHPRIVIAQERHRAIPGVTPDFYSFDSA